MRHFSTAALLFILCGCLVPTFGQETEVPVQKQNLLGKKARPAGPRPMNSHVTAVLERMKTTRPDEYRRLQQLRINDRQEFFRQMRALMPADARHQFFAKFKQMEKEQNALAEKYCRATDPEEKEQTLQLLKKNIDEGHELFLADMKKRIARMQKKISQMEANSEKIKEQKLQRLLKKHSAQEK